MSRRTVESNKAILSAWNKEKELVQEGKGTRDWTPKQQQDILEKGKAYDEDGVAFQGQHMKSAEMYPEYQGDPRNIQFLTRAEHLEAHNGNWRNPTNWYFNPITKEKIDFGEGSFIPCDIIQLQEPIMKLSDAVEVEEEKLTESIKKEGTKKASRIKQESDTVKVKLMDNIKPDVKQTSNFGDTVKKTFKAVLDFSNRHPVFTGIAKVVIASGLVAVTDAVVNGDRSSYGDSISSDNNHTLSSSGDSSLVNTYDRVQADTVNMDTSLERSSVKEHTVRPHGQNYIKKGKRVWIEKDSYIRGCNKNN